jgi:hypothetical protein
MVTFFVVLFAIPCALVGAFVLWLCYQVFWVGRSLRRKEAGFCYVCVNDDGTVRELSTIEQEYLTTEFSPGDGDRPYIKSHFEALDGWNSISGYIERRQVPAHIPIQPVDPDAE